MKKLVSILLSVILILLLAACGKDEPVSFEDSCWEKVEDCETTVLDNGTVSVTLTAPDYTAIIKYLEESGVTGDLTIEMLADAVKDHPDAVKEYSFIADSDQDDAIRDALMEQIAYEMLVIALEDTVG